MVKPCVFLHQLSTQYLLEAAMCLSGWGRQAQKTMLGKKRYRVSFIHSGVGLSQEALLQLI